MEKLRTEISSLYGANLKNTESYTSHNATQCHFFHRLSNTPYDGETGGMCYITLYRIYPQNLPFGLNIISLKPNTVTNLNELLFYSREAFYVWLAIFIVGLQMGEQISRIVSGYIDLIDIMPYSYHIRYTMDVTAAG